MFVIQWAGAVVYTCGGCGLVGFLVRRRHMPNGHRGVFGGGQMAAPGFAMRVGGAQGRFVWVPMRPLGARPPWALPTAARGTLGALRAWLYAVCSNPQLLPVHIPEPRWCFHAHPGRPRRLSETPGFNPGLILACWGWFRSLDGPPGACAQFHTPLQRLENLRPPNTGGPGAGGGCRVVSPGSKAAINRMWPHIPGSPAADRRLSRAWEGQWGGAQDRAQGPQTWKSLLGASCKIIRGASTGR